MRPELILALLAAVVSPVTAGSSEAALEAPSQESSPISDPANALAKAKEASFRVRQGIIGAGFDPGIAGRLRVSELGLEFIAAGSSRPVWTVRWAGLELVRKDEGIWDVPFPLVIMDRSGRKHYLALLDERDRCIPGDQVLAEISSRHPKGKAAVRKPVGKNGGASEPGGEP